MGNVTDPIAGPAVMGAGPVVAAMLLGAAHAPAWLIVGGVVAGLLVWDLAAYGQSLTTELGWTPATDRVETVHAAGAVVIALCFGLVAVGVDAFATAVAGGVVSRPAFVLLGLGVATLVWLLGR
jgi:hypothetical protein